MKIKTLLFITLVLVLSGCVHSGPATQTNNKTGSDKDAHGCIASAGYQWCGKTGQCERPWKLARQEGFDNTSEAFDAFCENTL